MKMLLRKLLEGVSLPAHHRLLITLAVIIVAAALKYFDLEEYVDGVLASALVVALLDQIQTVKRNSMRPPPPVKPLSKIKPFDEDERDTNPGIGPTVLALSLASSLAFGCGCGASGLELQAKAAESTARILEASQAVIEGELRARSFDCVDTHDAYPAAEACVEAVEGDFEPLVVAQNIAADAHKAWVLALLAAHRSDNGLTLDELAALAAHLVEMYSQAAATAERIGIELPFLGGGS